MLILYYLFLKNPVMLFVSYLLQVIPYFFILKKMELNRLFALVPFVAEYQFNRKVFPKRRTFFRSFIVSAILVAFAYYINPYKGVGFIYILIAFIIYGFYLLRLYNRLRKAFGKKWFHIISIIFFTPIFLLILGLGKSEFTQPVFPPDKPCSPVWKIVKKVSFVAISIVELVAIVVVPGFFAIRQRMPRILVNQELDEIYDYVKDVTNTCDVVTREDVLQEEVEEIIVENQTRDYYFADHSEDEEVVVFTYIIGSNLEDANGLASTNILQMIDATKNGTGLKFVIEAGGSNRWFTKGIDDCSYGRYEIYNGELTKIESLPADTNMATQEALTDFLTWSKESYSADRQMLILWDHGGGFAYGYGIDNLNGTDDCMTVTSMVNAFEEVDVKYDVIGFDACLMQDIEIAKVFEPYADYYIASQEVESGLGWSYTYAFGELAKNPGMDTTEFGEKLISCFDAYNRAVHDGEAQTGSTLSIIDLTIIDSAYEKLEGFLDTTTAVVKENPSAFANFSIAAENTYSFQDQQIDLIGFLDTFDNLDYDHEICTEEEKEDLLKTLQASVVCHNGDSAYGINGLAISFTIKNSLNYSSTYEELKNFSMNSEENAFSVIYSIIGAQKMKIQSENGVSIDTSDLISFLESIVPTDYTKFEWYIPGFENYDNTPHYIDIPLTEVEGGYQIELPENTWSIISDVQTMVYQKVDEDDAYIRYLGNDYLGGIDENGHTLVSADENWVHINNQIVCYEADQVRITDEGEVYTGKIKARLNNSEDIYILIEWDAVDEDAPEQAHVIGYVKDVEVNSLEEKGTSDLVAGDTIQFLFDYYDEEGNFIETRTAGKKIRVTKQERLKVVDQKMDHCTIQFGGALKDVYQRVMSTEMIELTIE